jgi:hypothetical protein
MRGLFRIRAKGDPFKGAADGSQRLSVYAYKIDYVNYQAWITVENPSLTVNGFPNAMAELWL